MQSPQDPVPTTVPQALGRLRIALEDGYARASRQLGLTAQQAELLCAVLSPAAVGDLAKVLRCDRSNVSRLVDRAAANGLLRRRAGEEDGRVTIVELSPKGRRLAERFIQSLESQTQTLLDGWPAKRSRLAIGIFNEIADRLDQSRTPHPADHRSADSRARRGHDRGRIQ